MRCFSVTRLSSAVLEMIDSPALSFRDAQKIFNVKFNVEYVSILRTTPVPKPLNAIINPGKQKEPEALGKRNSKRRLFLPLRKSLSCLQPENALFVSLSVCRHVRPSVCPPAPFFSFFLIYLFLDWLGRKQHYFWSKLFLTCALLLVTLTQGKVS